MTDRAYEVPLHEQLARVPRDARLIIDDLDGMGTQYIPVGRYCHEAAEVIRDRLAQPEPWVKTYSGGKPNYTEPCERCGEVNPAEIHTCTPKESFEYWNAVEGWVKIDEVRQHFDTAGCGTIYKTGGEGRVPLYAAREWQGLTNEEKKVIYQEAANEDWTDLDVINATEAKLREKNA